MLACWDTSRLQACLAQVSAPQNYTPSEVAAHVGHVAPTLPSLNQPSTPQTSEGLPIPDLSCSTGLRVESTLDTHHKFQGDCGNRHLTARLYLNLGSTRERLSLKTVHTLPARRTVAEERPTTMYTPQAVCGIFVITRLCRVFPRYLCIFEVI